MKDTETLDKFYLEWSQFTKAETATEIKLKNALRSIQNRAAKGEPVECAYIHQVVNSALIDATDWYSRRASEERAEGREQNAVAYESFGKVSSDRWMLNCQYLLDVLDQQGFSEADLSEEDDIAIKGIRVALSNPTSQP